MKNEAELAQILGEALRLYSVQVKNGVVRPFKSILEGKPAVVRMTLTTSNSLKVEEVDFEAVGEKLSEQVEASKDYKKTIEKQEKEITSLKKEAPQTATEEVDEPEKSIEEVEAEKVLTKPRRRTKA